MKKFICNLHLQHYTFLKILVTKSLFEMSLQLNNENISGTPRGLREIVISPFSKPVLWVFLLKYEHGRVFCHL